MDRISRRAALSGMGHVAALGSLAAALPPQVFGEEAEESAVLWSQVYPNAPKAKFDMGYYRDKHIPLVRSLLGDTVERTEARVPRKVPVVRSRGSAMPDTTPPSMVLASTSIWIRDIKAFVGKAAPLQQLVDDLANFTDVQPFAQYDRVALLMGGVRSAVDVDGQVFSTYFPAQEGKTFDARYYGEKVIPLMVKLYGAKCLHRIEYTLGQSQGGVKPGLVAAAHFYIRDRAAWDAAGMQAGMQLMAEAPKYTTIIPFMADTEVLAIA